MDAKESREGLSRTSRDERSLLKLKLEALVFWEQIFWGQIAKLKWAKDGDIDQDFFIGLRRGKGRRISLKIWKLGKDWLVNKERANR